MSKEKFTYALLATGDTANIPVNTYYIEEESATDYITNAPIGSKAILVREDGTMEIMYLRSTGWVMVK